MTEDRLIDIESKLAHQEHTLIELNAVITNQQKIIMKLEKLCDSLADRVQSIGEVLGDDIHKDEKPPHY